MFVCQDSFIAFLKEQQGEFLNIFERIDGGNIKAQTRSWQRPGGGGGQMGVLRGQVVEKGACNVSVVHGLKTKQLEMSMSQLQEQDLSSSPSRGSSFFACGLSSIIHMTNPHAPIAHLNVRYFQVGDEQWFGGGADLTPFLSYDADNSAFHDMLKHVCDQYHPHGQEAYPQYRAWCDEYYYIKHRQQPRGVGGIFFDRVKASFTEISPFIIHLVRGYIGVLEDILERRKDLPFTENQKQDQLYWRGRYVEFNLLYDKGTRFGLDSGGDLEALFVSLPPMVRW